ncbi:DUF4890 domain-containing protein [Algoriphagus halophytocola]|uniref:DUF4890 domain-containing protein n=1 Tax=Algoriphagus halophytocola TaxID=2991499 RepID=A0ABY6MD44_9BACT|nr:MULTISPECIES: DUF4890 domain-containing protein [unclassified Algoriphagus]UZD21453.1 DUF4890 domain-containing protein [Algoriphagus sp. TR-M5]WBL42665.1 DUF4890 domain-containing protein [Algoriphagus sp. TR-M9]
MNKWILATGMMVMISLGTMAQKRGGDRPSPEQRAKMSTEKMAEQLQLSEEQQKQILEINLEYAKKREAEMAERKAEAEERRAQMQAMRAEMKAQDEEIQLVLTEEQRAQWIALKEELRSERRRGRPNAQIEDNPRRRGGGNN